MSNGFKRNAIAILLAPALALPLTGAQAAGQPQQAQQQNMQQRQAVTYANRWSADQLISTEVRNDRGEQIGEVKDILVDHKGKVSRVIVEVGGFLEMGDQHIGVPWKDVTLHDHLDYIQVPLKEVEDGTYSLYGRVPHGENVRATRSEWRVNEVIGDFASLTDVPRYGMVTDIIFDESGQAQSVIVNRRAGDWGAPGHYGAPYRGYNEGWTYAMPIDGARVNDLQAFDYEQFARESRFASAQNMPPQRDRQSKNR